MRIENYLYIYMRIKIRQKKDSYPHLHTSQLLPTSRVGDRASAIG